MNTIRQLISLRGADLWVISPQDTVFNALRMMAKLDVGALVVMDGARIVGMFSERDYARKIILKGPASKKTRVAEIMSTPVITIHPDQTVEEALALMTTCRIRYLPVIEDDHVLSVISLNNVVRDIISRQSETIKVYEEFESGRSVLLNHQLVAHLQH
ncbi:MAG: CBS domain-containing protein [Anaerolineae bacterium]|jgi:CBS domain-containing protein|nr:CBS domain-containing protein [Anaerolineae bacterium]